jgi:hypothetical protein
MAFELSRRVPCTVRCWRTGSPAKLELRDRVFHVCPECGEMWTLNQLDNWADTVEAVVAVMNDYLDFSESTKEAFEKFLERSSEGRKEAYRAMVGDRVDAMTLPVAMELADSLLVEGLLPYEAKGVVLNVIRVLRGAVLDNRGPGDVPDIGEDMAKALDTASWILDGKMKLQGRKRHEEEQIMMDVIRNLSAGVPRLVAKLKHAREGDDGAVSG